MRLSLNFLKVRQYMGKKQRNIDVCKKLSSSCCYFSRIKLAKIRFKFVYNRCLRWICFSQMKGIGKRCPRFSLCFVCLERGKGESLGMSFIIAVVTLQTFT